MAIYPSNIRSGFYQSPFGEVPKIENAIPKHLCDPVEEFLNQLDMLIPEREYQNYRHVRSLWYEIRKRVFELDKLKKDIKDEC